LISRLIVLVVVPHNAKAEPDDEDESDEDFINRTKFSF
jgi:hypothetical protein